MCDLGKIHGSYKHSALKDGSLSSIRQQRCRKSEDKRGTLWNRSDLPSVTDDGKGVVEERETCFSRGSDL